MQADVPTSLHPGKTIAQGIAGQKVQFPPRLRRSYGATHIAVRLARASSVPWKAWTIAGGTVVSTAVRAVPEAVR